MTVFAPLYFPSFPPVGSMGAQTLLSFYLEEGSKGLGSEFLRIHSQNQRPSEGPILWIRKLRLREARSLV